MCAGNNAAKRQQERQTEPQKDFHHWSVSLFQSANFPSTQGEITWPQ
jgi:hypothetical protein